LRRGCRTRYGSGLPPRRSHGRLIDHSSFAFHDLDRASEAADPRLYADATGVHPFGTSNHLAMFENNFLELLAVTDPAAIPAARGPISFAAHQQNFLATAEGMSMLALHTPTPMPMRRASRQMQSAPTHR